jgi:hypothetical protein
VEGRRRPSFSMTYVIDYEAGMRWWWTSQWNGGKRIPIPSLSIQKVREKRDIIMTMWPSVSDIYMTVWYSMYVQYSICNNGRKSVSMKRKWRKWHDMWRRHVDRQAWNVWLMAENGIQW